MKVLVIAENLSPPAVETTGMRSIYELQKNLAKLGIEVQILTSIISWTSPKYKKWFKKQDIPFHTINAKLIDSIPLTRPLRFPYTKIRLLLKAIRLHSKHKFDIIHEYSSSPLLIRITQLYKKILKTHTIHTLCTYNESPLGSYKLAGKMKDIDQVICVTKHLQKLLQKKAENKEKIITIPLGTETQKFSKTASRKRSKKKQVITYLGPIEGRKGVFVLAKAIPIVLKKNKPLFAFATYGKGGVDPKHEKNKKKLMDALKENIDSVEVTEGPQNIPKLMARTDIFVLPQSSPHGTIATPITLIEAMASGKPIIASNTPGVNEAITDGKNGLLFKPEDHEELAEKILILLRDKQKAKQLGNNAKKHSSRYDTAKIAKKIHTLYSSILK